MNAQRFSMSDQLWQRPARQLPGNAGDAAKDNHLFFETVFCPGRTGAPWRDHDAGADKWRRLVTNCFAKVKEFRAKATRYDKTDHGYGADWPPVAARIASR